MRDEKSENLAIMYQDYCENGLDGVLKRIETARSLCTMLGSAVKNGEMLARAVALETCTELLMVLCKAKRDTLITKETFSKDAETLKKKINSKFDEIVEMALNPKPAPEKTDNSDAIAKILAKIFEG